MSFAWGNHSNGRIPPSALADAGGVLLRADAAAAARALAAAFKARFGKELTYSEGFRSYATQVHYRQLYESGNGFPAATPGSSIHGWGLAIDINSWGYGGSTSTAEHEWLRTEGRKYGWSWDTTGRPSGEPWHFDFVLTPTVNIFTDQEEEEIMGAAQEIREHTQAVANNLQAYVTKHTQDVANNSSKEVKEYLAEIVRRESRLRLFFNTEKREWVAISQQTGVILGPTKDKAHVDAWVALQYIGPTEKDKPVHFSNAQIDVLLTHMANLRAQIK